MEKEESLPGSQLPLTTLSLKLEAEATLILLQSSLGSSDKINVLSYAGLWGWLSKIGYEKGGQAQTSVLKGIEMLGHIGNRNTDLKSCGMCLGVPNDLESKGLKYT